MLKEIEKEYLEKNSIYFIQRELIDSMNLDSLKDFILPLYKDYKNINTAIEKCIDVEKKKYSELTDLDIYYLEEVIKLKKWWNRYKELKNILSTLNTHLFSKLSKYKWYKTNNKDIDINSIPIVDVIWLYTKLPSNIRRNIHCPIHQDKTASFKIYINTNSFYCFWCKRGWNAINLISNMESVTTKDAFKKFIEYFNL